MRGCESPSLAGWEAASFDVYETKRIALSVGDRIRITQNGYVPVLNAKSSLPLEAPEHDAPPTKAKGRGKNKRAQRRLINGAVYEIARFLKNGDLVLNNGWVLPRSYGHVAHGYCTTSHASQGMTADTVLISQSTESFRASSSEQFYVSCSRGKTGIKIYTDSVDELFEAVCRSHQQTSAADLMLAEPSSEPFSVRIKFRRKQRALTRQRKATERAVTTARRRRSRLKIAVEQGASVIASVNETLLKTGIVAGESVIVSRDITKLYTTAICRGEIVCAPFVPEAAKPVVAPPVQKTIFVPMFSPEPQSNAQQISI